MDHNNNNISRYEMAENFEAEQADWAEWAGKLDADAKAEMLAEQRAMEAQERALTEMSERYYGCGFGD